MKNILFAILFALTTNAQAENPDEHPGKKLFKDNCMGACHAHDNDDLFLRNNSIVKDRKSLSKVVSFCTSNIGVAIFPEDEKTIADYLNRKYYKYP